MGLRISTWNVNGIRNPFGYQPWRDKRSFQAMFDILEADIVVLQETKIQRKDLSDDMVLVPGWDCYFSLPRHKKGYSGVVIYTRQSVCAPIRAEEGITGLLCLPNSSTAFMNLPHDQQIGSYPSPAQLAESSVDAILLDSEGRCVILEFPAFVLLGVYCPANRDETRDDFRLGFLNVLDARIRNLVANGKRVFLTGDLNISREELDAANAQASMRKIGLDGLDFVSTPARRLLNQLLEGGKVFGERDKGREVPAMWDICRAFYPNRQGMFTCWEQKVNARPGNCGARIDYVLCSLAMKDWFCDSNIQEGLMGSDHCPVYAIMKDKLIIDERERDMLDVMNPEGMFLHGKRQREYSASSDPLHLSGRLITEFSGRRNIREMFFRESNLSQAQSSKIANTETIFTEHPEHSPWPPSLIGAKRPEDFATSKYSDPGTSSTASVKKRSAPQSTTEKMVKRTKPMSASSAPSEIGKGQQSLKGYFKPKSPSIATSDLVLEDDLNLPSLNTWASAGTSAIAILPRTGMTDRHLLPSQSAEALAGRYLDGLIQPMISNKAPVEDLSPTPRCSASQSSDVVHDPIVSRESWSKLFTKPLAPRCESHDEPCISMLTKKQGFNLGRSFWMCSRPLGPFGVKEKNTQWRCGTFIWCSDWNPKAASAN